MSYVRSVYLAIEALRLALWIGFVVWLVSAYNAEQWVGPEASSPSILAAMWLGFPYSWFASFVFDSWDLIPIGTHVVLRIAFVHFALWAVTTGCVCWLFWRKRGQERSKNNTGHQLIGPSDN